MQFLIGLALFIAVAFAAPAPEQIVSVTQDTLGNYKIGYNILGQSKQEERTADGTVRGGYSYIDANGVPQELRYVAGVNGFQAVGSLIPVPPAFNLVPVVDTPEVAAAKAAHLALLGGAGGYLS